MAQFINKKNEGKLMRYIILFLFATLKVTSQNLSKDCNVLIENINYGAEHASYNSVKLYDKDNKLVFGNTTRGKKILTLISLKESLWPLRISIGGYYVPLTSTNPVCKEDISINYSLLNFNTDENLGTSACDGEGGVYGFNLNEPQVSVGICDKIKIAKRQVTKYQYMLPGKGWVDFPISNQTLIDGILTLNFKPIDLLGSSVLGNIMIKGILEKNNNYDTLNISNNGILTSVPSFETNIITYTITSCSLKLLSSLPNMVKCAGGSDGSIRFKFDRDLESADEKLNLILKNSKGGVLGTRSVSASEFNNKNQEYIWEGIPSDTYILNYQVIKNNNGSIPLESNPIIVGTPEALSFTTTAIQPVSCYDGNNGQFMLTPGGGTGKYNYTISNVISNQVIVTGEIARGTSTTLTGLKKGEYKIELRDENNCRISSVSNPTGGQIGNVIITEPNAIAVSLEKENIKCFSSATGKITVRATRGSETFLYSKDNGANWVASPVFDNLTAGTYGIKIKDASNCEMSINDATATGVTLTQPEELKITTVLPTHVVCNGESNGSITVTATGGVGNYQYRLKGKPWQSTNVFGNLSAGAYTLEVQDQNFCNIQTQPISILQPAILSFEIEKSRIQCHGGKGSITIVKPSGGTGPYEYSIDQVRWQNSPFFNNLTAGIYQVSIRDTKKCQGDPATIELTEPSVITYDVIKTDIPCYNESTGKIEVYAQGGNSNYVYSKDGGLNWQTANTFTNLPHGTYAIQVANPLDVGYCIAPQGASTVEIIAPSSALTFTASFSNTLCQITDTATLTIVANGGYGNYQYSIDNGVSWSNQAVHSDLKANNYKVLVRDRKSLQDAYCISNEQTLELVAPLQATISTQDISCYGAKNGKIKMDTQGGTQPYTYYINGRVFTTSEILIESKGNYSCYVQDAKGCRINFPDQQITEPNLLTATATIYPVTNSSTHDGKISISAQGGTAPYSYQWIPDMGNNNNLVNLGYGDYQLSITDSKGCRFTQNYKVETIQPLSVKLDPVKTKDILDCYGNSNGKLSIIIEGGRPNPTSPFYKIEWKNENQEEIGTTGTIQDLKAGSYTVQVTDYNTPASTIEKKYTIVQPLANLKAQLNQSQTILCANESTAKITAIVTGGTTPYSYQWENNKNTVVGTTSELLNQPAGIYSCKITDAKRCFVIETIDIKQPSPLAATLEKKDVTIYGQATGEISVKNILGGVAPYQYVLNGGIAQGSASFTGLVAGNYTVNVIDANNCSLDLPITIIQPDLLQVKVANPTQSVIKCYGDTSVSLQANAIGGVAPYFYKWKKNGNLISNAEFSEIKRLGAGLYEVEVKDSKGALEQAQYQVIQPQALKATYTVSPVSCANPLGGRIQLNVEGGSQPYHYKWNTNYSGTNVTPSDKFNQLTNIGLGVYNVTITDAQGCKIDLTGLQVGSSGGLELNATVKDVSCGETNNGSILINPLGGTGNYTIDWADSSFRGLSLTNLSPRTYIGTLIDRGSNCRLPFSLVVNGSSPLVVNLGEDVVLCKGQSHLIDAQLNDSKLRYNWTSSNGFSSNESKVRFTQSGIYKLEVITINGCVYSDEIEVKLEDQLIEAKFMVATQTFKNEEIVFVNISNNTDNHYKWKLPPSAKIVSETPENVVAIFNETGKYKIGIECNNAQGCNIEEYNEIIVEENKGEPIRDEKAIFVKQFTVYPNPVSTSDHELQIEVELAFEQPLTLSLYRIETGALINQIEKPASKKHKERIDFNYASGTYYIIMKTKGAVQAKKIIRK